jgi:hypothetical protein
MKNIRIKNNMENKGKKKRRWDAVAIGIGMVLAFSMIIMKITGYWPCRIASTLHIKQVSCDKSIQENTSSIIHWIQQQFQEKVFPHFLLQFPQNI